MAVSASVAGLFGFIWWIGISLETQAGFAGNPRYAVLGVMFICVSGCTAYGWACIGVATLAVRGLHWLQRRARTDLGSTANQWTWVAGAATLAVLVVFAVVPDRFTNRMPTVSSIRYQLRYQARLREQFASLIQREGGASKVTHCGSMMTNNFQVTMLAWDLDVPIYYIQALPRNFPKVANDPGPNVVFQDATSSGGPVHPTNPQMQDWDRMWKRKNGSQYKVIKDAQVTLYVNCSAYSRT